MTHQHGHLRSAGSCRRSVRGLAAGGAALAAAALAVAPLSGAAAAPRPAATAASGTTVWGWGPNLAGELGRARPAVAKTPIRASLPRGTRITSVRAGCFATLALTSTGKVLGWGDDSL